MAETGFEAKEQRHYTFPVSSGMLAPGHVSKIGEAIWCFLWCVDRTTSEVLRDGERRGRVLGGYVIPSGRISKELGLPVPAIQEQLRHLAREKYLDLTPQEDGYIIEVRRSIKWVNRRTDGERSGTRRGGDPAPMKTLVEGLKERLAAREQAGDPEKEALSGR